MSDSQEMLDNVTSALIAGTLSKEQQHAMGNDLAKVGIEHRRMRRTLDEQYREAREQDALDRAALPPSAQVYEFPARGVIAADLAS